MDILRAFSKTQITKMDRQKKTKKAYRILATSRGSFQTTKPLKTNKIKILSTQKIIKTLECRKPFNEF